MTNSIDGHAWANKIQKGAAPDGIAVVLAALEELGKSGVTPSSMIIAFCQVLAQGIVSSGFVAPQVRGGIIAIIDGYATEIALQVE